MLTLFFAIAIAIGDFDEKNRYYKVFKTLFTQKPSTYVFTSNQLIIESERENLLVQVDHVIIFLTEAFSNYWTSLDWLKSLIKDKNFVKDLKRFIQETNNNLSLDSNIDNQLRWEF